MALKQADRLLFLKTPLGEDELVLGAFSGREEISRPFRYELEMLSHNTAVEPKQIVGKNVTFGIKMPDGKPRHFNGFVSRFYAGNEDARGLRSYRAEVVPWLWFLTRASDCRIFQDKTVPEIIEQVFQDLGFSDFEISQIKGQHPKREYCVQYRESSFQFVSRLMEEEGIFYFFKHEEGKHTLVMADQKAAYTDCRENEVDYPPDVGTGAIADHVTSWEHRYEFRTGKIAQTDYNFEKHPARSESTPAKLLLANQSTTVKLDDVDKYEFYDYPGTYADKGQGDDYTKIRMEEEEAGHDVVDAGSTCRSFTPGGKFKIKRHVCSAEAGKKYVITAIAHSATEPGAYGTGEAGGFDYRNTFTCIPDSVTFRPQRLTPRPVVQGLQPAVVTGPSGEEVYVDKYGRVKVQFFWDRQGKRDEKSSCWVRVSQVYAGKKWGFLCIPRIGQEALVDFLEGNPDRPVIVGRVYNADQMPPFDLPGKKVVSGFKSDSTPGGGGYNEISFDDTKGKEKVTIHGQYDLNSQVEHDQEWIVGNDDTLNVGKKLTIEAGDQIIIRTGQSSITMKKDGTITIAGKEITVKATQKIQEKAVQISSQAQAKHEVKGAMVDSKATGVNTLSGAMVKIN